MVRNIRPSERYSSFVSNFTTLFVLISVKPYITLNNIIFLSAAYNCSVTSKYFHFISLTKLIRD